MKKIYLDYAASTPVDKKVLEEMLPFFSEKIGNASSMHSFGQESAEAVEKARKILIDFFGAKEKELIFTSGATESNNIAIKGTVRAYYSVLENKEKKPHIITTAFEHSCVLKTCQKLEKEGLIELSIVTPDSEGIVSPKDIEKLIQKNTILVSVMYVNNEIGTVQPISEIGKIIKEARIKNKESKENYPLLHTDATQAVNYCDCNVEKLGVDMMSMSAHKIYGPKGVGALYIRQGVKMFGIQDGGEQEFGRRAGTLNTPGIVGLGKAVELLAKDKDRDAKKVKVLRDYLINRVLKEIPRVRLNGSKEKRAPHNANFSFQDVEGESLLLFLDMEGIAVSTGSACSSGSLSPSHVLLSIGLKPEQAHGSLRVSLGKHTTKKEIDIFITKLKKIVEKIRKISGNILGDYYANSRNIQHVTRNH